MYKCFCNGCSKTKNKINDYYCINNRGVCEDCLEKGITISDKKDIDLWAKYRPKNLYVDNLITE